MMVSNVSTWLRAVRGLVIFAVLAVLAQTVAVAVVVDQDFQPGPTNAGPVASPSGQSFTAGVDGLITEIWVLSWSTIPMTGTIEIRSGDGLGGPILGGPLPFVAAVGPEGPPAGIGYTWRIIDVSSLGVSQVAGQQYSFVMPTNPGNWYLNCAGGYAGGGYLDTGHATCSPIAAPPGTGDLNFRTFVEPPAVPTLSWLGGIGLAAALMLSVGLLVLRLPRRPGWNALA